MCQNGKYYLWCWCTKAVRVPSGGHAALENIKLNIDFIQQVFYPAVTVSQCPHSEVGQDFLLRRRVTLTETAVTRKRKV